MPVGTGIYIKQYLLENGEAYPYEIWKRLKQQREEEGMKSPTYESFYTNYIWKADQLGLIRKTQEEESKGKFDRQYYEMSPGEEESACWFHIQQCYAPVTGIGGKDYRNLKEEAEEKNTTVEELYIQNNSEEIKQIADEVGVSEAEIVRRIRKSRPF